MAELQQGNMFPQRTDSAMPEDPAFEPRSDFMFGDGGEDEFSNMERNLDAMNGFHDQHSQQGTDGMNADGMQDQFNPALMQSMNSMNSLMFDNAGVSPDFSALQNSAHSMHRMHAVQSDMANRRSESVVHQFGQITPPDDDTSKTLSAPTIPARATPPSQAMSAQSERARNAANQRHAKAKKARRDSTRKEDDLDDGEEGEVEDKRERYREKNRLAAAKCRAKKKTNTEDLEESARSATAQNNRLRAEERELRDLFSSLRDQALAHDPSQGCNCQAIHAYNMHKAHETARATMGFVPGTMPSPSQRSVDSSSPSAVGTTSRAPSLSDACPQSGCNSGLSQSTTRSAGFVPSTAMGGMVLHQPVTGDKTQSSFAFNSQAQQPSPIMMGEQEGFQ